jgi:hypothetical protein
MFMLKKKIFAIFCISLIITIFTGCGGVADVGPPTGSSSVSLAWEVPTTYIDGTVPATGPVGFKVYYGTASRAYTHIVDVKDVSSCTINNLAHGTYYFAVTAYDSSGIESDYSAELIKNI